MSPTHAIFFNFAAQCRRGRAVVANSPTSPPFIIIDQFVKITPNSFIVKRARVSIIIRSRSLFISIAINRFDTCINPALTLIATCVCLTFAVFRLLRPAELKPIKRKTSIIRETILLLCYDRLYGYKPNLTLLYLLI